MHLVTTQKQDVQRLNIDFQEFPKLFDIDELRKSKRYVIKAYGGAVYEGEMVDGKREGPGIMKYNNGRLYFGYWQNNLRHGKGFEKFPNGNSYEGTFAEGKAAGKGVYRWGNGEAYEGEWVAGKKHGDGIWRGSRRDSYIGEWRNNKAEGYGVHIWANGNCVRSVGDRYEGEWKECLKHGNGTDSFSNGDVYIGQYRYGRLRVIVGKPCGYGQYTWKNGSTFVGEFLNGLKNGFGKYRKTKANRTNMYEGEYLKDKKEGFGIFKWASGNIYRGQYKEDEREGIGEMRWVDGSSYIGQWERGIQHGYGRMKFLDGSMKEGLFENNIYKGPAPKGEVPLELKKPEFDIMSLAPKGVAFSAEICFWNTALPQSETPRFELPLLKSSRSESVIVKKMARYLGRPLNTRNSCKPSSTSQASSVRKRAQSNTSRARSIKSTARKTSPRLSLAPPQGSHGNKRVRLSVKSTALTSRSPPKKSGKRLRKKIWIPSGIAHLNGTSSLK